jgi:hypothetical protein
MSSRLDALQLDLVWDASVQGQRLPLPIDDLDERDLLELLANSARPAPNAAFARALEQELALTDGADSVAVSPAVTPIAKPRTANPSTGLRRRPSSRWMTAGYALAAIALIVFLSSFAIAWQSNPEDNGRSIPAVSQWTEAGPPTSPGVETTPIFSHAFTVEDLANFSMDQWGWAELVLGTVGPGARSFVDPTRVQTGEIPGMSVISVYSGQLNARLVKAAVIYRQNGAISESISGPAEISIGAGDTLVFGVHTLAELSNPTESDTAYIAGGLYTKPADPILFTDDRTSTIPQGISFQTSMFAGVSSLQLSTDRVVVEPGQTFAYSITSQTLFLANVVGGELEKQEWANGERQGKTRALVPSSYSFHRDGPGYYTLTNTGTEPVEILLFKVASTQIASATAVPVAIAETRFSKILSPEEMDLYGSSSWRWISFMRGTLQPGEEAITVEGSPTAGDMGSYLNGLGAITITSGVLVANAASGAVVERGSTGAIEPVDRRADVILEAGDTLIVPANTLPAVWNQSDAAVTYLAGGVYVQSNVNPLNGLGYYLMRVGITVNPDDLATGAPITISLHLVTIPPGAAYAYSVSPATWLEANTIGGELKQSKPVDGLPQGAPKTLVASFYSFHSSGPGDYILTNDGNETVEVSFFRVEAQGTPEASGSSVAPKYGEQGQSVS